MTGSTSKEVRRRSALEVEQEQLQRLAEIQASRNSARFNESQAWAKNPEVQAIRQYISWLQKKLGMEPRYGSSMGLGSTINEFDMLFAQLLSVPAFATPWSELATPEIRQQITKIVAWDLRKLITEQGFPSELTLWSLEKCEKCLA